METDWHGRQVEMEDWYRAFAMRDDASALLQQDYSPYRETLAGLRGRVLDIGGGCGVAGRYLLPEVDYCVLDPSPIWRDASWREILSKISESGPAPRFVTGTGESLPFAVRQFDAALAFWSFNHASDPQRCLQEMHRVLRPGGQALLVLEDMEPSWADALARAVQSVIARTGRPVRMLDWGQGDVRTTLSTLSHKLKGRPWPLHADHLRIREPDLRRWFEVGFRPIRRRWEGGYLSYCLRRL